MEVVNCGAMRAFKRSDNDLYIDKDGLDKLFPAKMTVFENSLLLSARTGTSASNIDKLDSSVNDKLNQGVSQAAVISDVDTSDGENVTVILSTISATNGAVVIIGGEASAGVDSSVTDLKQQTLKEQQSLRFLLVEDVIKDKQMIFNGFFKKGFLNVDLANEGHEAYDSFVSAMQVKNKAAGITLPYDVIIISLNYAVSVSTGADGLAWDGFQAIRMIRQFEARLNAETGSNHHVKIIAVAKLDNVVNNDIEEESVAAGANLFMYLKQTNSFSTVEELAMRVPIHGPGVHTTQGMSQFQLDFEQK